MGTEQRFFKVAEVARVLGVSERTIRSGIRRGSIPAVRVGLERAVRVPATFIEKLERAGASSHRGAAA